MPANLEEDAVVTQQTTLEQRRHRRTRPPRASAYDAAPARRDGQRASTAFAAWPERLVVVGADGRIAYPGSPGPWGFSPEEAEEQLAALLGS